MREDLDYIRIINGAAILNGKEIAPEGSDSTALYGMLAANYPKFFKMDSLSKWAWLAAETLLSINGIQRHEGLDKTKVAVAICTTDGCLEVDKLYAASREAVPSPSLFVYTLPNIMLGEICIRHGFQGEQLCQAQESVDPDELLFWVKDVLQNRGMTHCLFGKVDSIEENIDVLLFWADAKNIQSFSAQKMQAIYDL